MAPTQANVPTTGQRPLYREKASLAEILAKANLQECDSALEGLGVCEAADIDEATDGEDLTPPQIERLWALYRPQLTIVTMSDMTKN